jgi:hypothetical protein
VEIDRFFIKEKLDARIISLTHISSRKQIADCLTKGLGTRECNLVCDKMRLIGYLPSILRGSVEHWTCFWPKRPKPMWVLTYKRWELEES